jgi:cytoskeletal protein CcmA (bactofilin family)
MFDKRSGEHGRHNKDVGKTFIAKGITISAGEIIGEGDVCIDGAFEGHISLNGHFIVGVTGTVSGDVKAQTALFAGTYSGHMSISDTVRFADGSNVTGEVEANKIIMDEGAVFKGRVTSAKIFQEEAGI